MLLAIVLALSIVACFLPWLKMEAAIGEEEPIKTDVYGYDYIVPLGAPYTAPVAILNVIGFILSAYSFKRIQRIKMLNVVAGLLILVGVIASFGYTTSAALADVSDKGGSFEAWGDYGMGLEALLGLLMIIIGALQKEVVAIVVALLLSKTVMQWGGIAAILVGTVSSSVGVYGLTGGADIAFVIKFVIGETVVSAQEDGLIFSIVGIIALLGGMAMTYIGFKGKLNRVEKVKLGLLVFSMAFLGVYAVFTYFPIFFSFKSTPMLWFFVIMIPFTVVTTTIIVFDYILSKILF